MKNLILLIFLAFTTILYSQSKVSLMSSANIVNAPLGETLFLHFDKLSFFVDVRITNFAQARVKKKNWSDYVDGNYYSYNSYVTDWGSYDIHSGSSKYRYGFSKNFYVFNFGVAKSIFGDENFYRNGCNIKLFLGVGYCRINKRLIKETTRFSHEHMNLELVDYESYSSDMSVTESIIDSQKINKINITSGLLFDWIGNGSLGIGFDTSPIGIVVMAGFNF